MAVAEPLAMRTELSDTARLRAWSTTVDHKRIGLLYVGTSLIFLVIGGLEALLIRWQLWAPELRVLGPTQFNQLFTMHGTTMIFFVVMPMLLGFANYLVPLMIGARDMAFPRLNALSYWLYALGGALTHFSFFAGGAPDVGWFAYAPLTEYTFSRGHSTDYWILGLLVSGLGSLFTGINLLTTILALRAPGMNLARMPLFVWMMLVDAILLIFAIPPLTAAQLMLLLDRSLGAHFFDTQAGGSALLWQHLFWFFGHPEVYILALPAFGMISEIVPVFSRKVIFGYESVAAATVTIGVISMGVWAHHMFTVGMSDVLDAIFSGASFLIAVPTGIKMFNWIATLYGGRLRFESPLLFAVGFLAMFVMGGLTGIMLAAVPIDWQVSDSYFVVAHFHYVLFGGSLFAIMAGFFYWFPKASGRRLSERLGRWQFWIMLAGFNLTFGPMHVAGLLGMPRRIYTYSDDRGWTLWNQLATVGALVLGVAFVLFFWNLFVSWRRGAPAGDDPWDAWTLEWATHSPPAPYNFETIPPVHSRRPLWDLKHPQDPDWILPDRAQPEVIA
ncbi:MAG: cytochrome c oxidase subunit I [Planctomycetaceae bacterium]|nr:cytochrome c oxidase subunit I [Planctomycetaceae bacterium]